MTSANYRYGSKNYRGSSVSINPAEKVKGHFINTSQIPRTNQLMLPRLVADLKFTYQWELTPFYSHLDHTPGIEGSGQNLVDIIQCGSDDERRAVVSILAKAGCSGLEILDEVCPSSLQ